MLQFNLALKNDVQMLFIMIWPPLSFLQILATLEKTVYKTKRIMMH